MAALRRHARLVIALPLALSAVVVGTRLLTARRYVARASFISSEPASISSSLGALSSIASQLGVPALGQLASGTASVSPQFYGDLLTSKELLHAVATTHYDASALAENGGKPFDGTLVDYFDPTAPTQADRELAAMDALSRSLLTVIVDRPTGVVRFEVRTKNRQLSALVARRFLDLVNQFNLLRRQTQASAERDFDERRTTAALDELHATEVALADFRAANRDFSHSPNLATREAELQRRVALAQQLYTTIAQRFELASIEAVRNTPVVTVIDAPEGLVEALPRYTRTWALGALFAGLIVATTVALYRERLVGVS